MCARIKKGIPETYCLVCGRVRNVALCVYYDERLAELRPLDAMKGKIVVFVQARMTHYFPERLGQNDRNVGPPLVQGLTYSLNISS